VSQPSTAARWGIVPQMREAAEGFLFSEFFTF
jgi:hypothetical protein